MNHLTSTKQFDNLRYGDQPFIIYKHSPICPIANRACGEVHELIHSMSDTENLFYQVDVITNRDVSQHIAWMTGVTHESPQIIFCKPNENDGMQLIDDASHGTITQSYMQQIIKKL